MFIYGAIDDLYQKNAHFYFFSMCSIRLSTVNALELLAAKFAVQVFLKARFPPDPLLIVLGTDNSTTAAYINKMGPGTRSYLLNSITKIFGYGVWKDT